MVINMKNQKLFAAALAAFVAAGMLSGCTADKNEGGSEITQENAASTETEAAAERSPKVTVEGTKFMVGGKELLINGVNTPWENWNDFGGNFDETFWDSHFADLHEIGVNSVRVWVNCNSMVGIKLKESGIVRVVEEKHWEDIDKLFEIAEKHRIYLMPTLLSFDHFKTAQYAERWRAIVMDGDAMQSYIDSYVKPFAERYGSNPYLLGIDLMNEPDWVIENEECGQLPKENLSEFFAKCTAAIHETNPDALVTVGIGCIKYNSDNGRYVGNIVSDDTMKKYGGENALLDFYSVHYYNYMKSWTGCPYDMSPTQYGLDGTKPAFIGETSAEGGETLVGLYEKCYNSGWDGVMMWMSNDGAEHAKNWSDIEEAAKRIAELAPEKVHPLEDRDSEDRE